MSWVEAWANVAIGYFIATGSQILIFPWFGIHIPISDNFIIGGWFTLISLIRSYLVRRWFDNLFHKQQSSILAPNR